MTPANLLWGLAVALAACIGFLLGRRALTDRLRVRERALSDECVGVALLAAEAGDHERALEWFRHARDLSPRNHHLARQEAWCLAELDRVDEALLAYAEASARSDDGMADFDAALLLLRHGRDPTLAEERLAAALRRTPALALEAHALAEVQPLRGRPAFERAMAQAYARLGHTPPPDRRLRP